jgi:hypothetical protein
MAEHTQPDQATRDEERLEAQRGHDPGRGPTDAESAAADPVSPDRSVADHEREMLEKGAHQQGEGRVP